MSQFSDKLVLSNWALKQLGIEDFDRLSEILRPPEYIGWGDDGLSKYVRQLVLRLPQSKLISNDQLLEYDGNITAHWKHISAKRNLQGQTLYPLYFQYLSLLFTEFYLDYYFRDRNNLLKSLNDELKLFNSSLDVKSQIDSYVESDLNKIAFWMATGSGKTLIMHCQIRQFVHYIGRAGKRHELNRIILLTPNEGLSRQHKEEFELSGIEADFYDKNGGTLFTGRGVDIIDIHKLKETSGDKTVAVDTFEGNNLVLVDEGHRGAGGEEWMDKRARLCSQGFSFEYSATFGQSIKAASGPKQKSLTQVYAKCILFDYSYKFFYNDGYGKDFNILNLAEEHEDETRPVYLTACLLSFYQQCRRFNDGGHSLVPYLLESPLMLFVGGSVTGQRQTQEDTDLILILKFLADFIGDRKDSERRLKKLLQKKDGLVVGGKSIFNKFFPYVEELYSPDQVGELFNDILKLVFNSNSSGMLHIVRLQGSEGEIGLRVGVNDWFGVVNVGDAKKLCELCDAKKDRNDHYIVEELSFSGSLFAQIKNHDSPIKILAGAKKFTEGWSSWRVSAMGLMNVGKKEGSEIIQLFGRGVRLKGYRFKLKRSSALDEFELQDEQKQAKHPSHIQLLETLNIFGIKSDYMKEFEDYLEEEGVGENDRREIIFLPTIQLPEFQKEKIQLHVIRPQSDMPDFKKNQKFCLDNSLEGRSSSAIIADWYPRLQKQSTLKGGAHDTEINQEFLRPEHLEFLSWDTIWFEIERYKRDKAYYNIVTTQESLKSQMMKNWWYELFIPPGYLEFRGLHQRMLWQDIAIHLLKAYLDKFYNFHKKEFESPYLEYQVLRPNDELVLREYQLLVKKSETQLIKQLKSLSENFKNGQYDNFSFESLGIFKNTKHHYQPLIHLGEKGSFRTVIKIVPTHLNDGEKDFLDSLERYCNKEAKGKLDNIELYLLRNHNSDKAISFFTDGGFRPDFILWIIQDKMQSISFIDPKGLRNFTDTFNNPKVKFSKKIKELESQLKRPDIKLESFLISQTSINDLKWPKPGVKDRAADKSDYLDHNIIFNGDSSDDSLDFMINKALGR